MYKIETITDRKVWDGFISETKPSTFLHAWAWGEAEKDTGKEIWRFGVYDKSEKLVAIALCVLLAARRGKVLICPHGPIIAEHVLAKEVMSSLKNKFLEIAKAKKCDVLRVCPILLDTKENIEIFKNLGFRSAPIHVYSELSWMLDIRLGEESLLSGMKKNTRYGIRKAEKDGIEIKSGSAKEDFEIFWNLYSKTAERQSFVPFPRRFVEAEFLRFRENDCIKLYFAYYKNKPISTAFIVFGPNSAFYHHGASLHEHGSITPGELLQWTIIKDVKARGLSYYDFWGVLPEGVKDHAWSRLDHFKKGFGGFPQAYVHAQDYPLSWKYLILYTIETVRRFKRNV